jgi:hypothetical protein
MTHWFDIPMNYGRLPSVKIIEAERCLKDLESIEDTMRTQYDTYEWSAGRIWASLEVL